MGSVLVSEEKTETDSQKLARLKQELTSAKDFETIGEKVLGIITINQESLVRWRGAIGVVFSRKLSDSERRRLRDRIRTLFSVKLVFDEDGINAELKFKK